MMPRMDGWAAREALAAIPRLQDTPVIFLSARAQQADLRRGYEAGVAEYVTKPFDPTELLDIIGRVPQGNYERPPLGGGRSWSMNGSRGPRRSRREGSAQSGSPPDAVR